MSNEQDEGAEGARLRSENADLIAACDGLRSMLTHETRARLAAEARGAHP